MKALTSTEGQSELPRYFAQVFARACRMEAGQVTFVLPDSRRFRADGARQGPTAELHVHDPDLFVRLICEGQLGFAEAYLDNSWSTPDLQAFMDLLRAAGDDIYDGFSGMGLLRLLERTRHAFRRNTKSQARRNIAAHYDLGNDFYRLWLDETMTYSSAMFATGQERLEEAQIAKYASLIDQMGVKPGDHVLEIGCGWGGFAEYAAAERGLRVTGLTISQAQHDYARERMRRSGLDDRVEVRLQDYRDAQGSYDGIASIEMFEAVGERYWKIYFDTVRDRLKPGRQATLQIITLPDHRWGAYRRGVDFIQKYIFPGGMLPSRSALLLEIDRADLRLVRSVEFGESYSQTLRRWHERFNGNWDAIADQGFEERFRRMWNFYLTSCAAAFAVGNCDVTQITMRRPA